MSDEDQSKIDEFRKRFGGSITVRRDEETIERRRKNIWEMWSEGVPQTAMAKILGVSRVTVKSDLDVMHKREQSYAYMLKNNPRAAELDIGITIKKLDVIAENAMAEYAAAQSPQDKDRFLNTSMKANALRNDILVKTGFLPKAGIEVKQTVEHTVSFEERFGKYKVMDDATARRKVLEVAERALKLGLTLEANTINAEAKVVEPPKP